MNARSVFSGFLILLLLLITAGCTQTTPPVTPAPTVETLATAVPTPVPTAFIPPTTEPVQTLPDIWSLEVQVYSNGEAINPMISVVNRGGKGLNFINQLDIKVTRSDGVIEEVSMVKPMYVGKTLEMKGTTQNNDRVEVWAYTPENQRVKIVDQIVPFRSYH
ncbi:MAG: hypothetical protein LUQ35_00580 [Methanoregula sp.]|jgi:hypothetical protein|nr:hypothetical protein [Methanoregula sp.]